MIKTICRKKKKKKLEIRLKEKKYMCKSCKETAHKDKFLCEPKKIKHAS